MRDDFRKLVEGDERAGRPQSGLPSGGFLDGHHWQTPRIIGGLFWIVFTLEVIGVLVAIISSSQESESNAASHTLLLVLLSVPGLVLVYSIQVVIFESVLVLFSIHRRLGKLSRELTTSQAQPDTLRCVSPDTSAQEGG